MTALGTEDFAAFFEAVWGYPPFSWQQELLERVVSESTWPQLIDLPTGLGKTATIDIALFALAIESDAGTLPTERKLPHRIVMVVDRRVVVDQAHDRARLLRSRITEAAADSVAGRVATALRARSDGGPPLLTSVLRGGIVRDEAWAKRPDVPTVLASTVDQVGSRLLFRGYGVSTGMRPVHAALLSHDTLYLLDEVHLARPFAETLAAVRSKVEHGSEAPSLPRRLVVVQLSATPAVAVESAERFPAEPVARPLIAPADLAALAPVDAVFARRIGNSKPCDLEVVKVPADTAKANEAFAKVVRERVKHRLAEAQRVGVIVNRVDTARRAARLLLDLSAKEESFDVALLTGRMRPLERDEAVSHLAARLAPGPRDPGQRPLVVVATQSLEAGADFDFDVLVTECASLDALKQRFGRVDRDGQRWAQGSVCRSLVLCRSTDADGPAEDPVYGTALHSTWTWLNRQPEVDFAHAAMAAPDPASLFSMLPPQTVAPLLAASHLDRWAQTSEHQISAEPEVAQWLHGVQATNEIADVNLIWRDGLDRSLFRWDEPVGSLLGHRTEEDLAGLVTELLSVVPPMAAEAMPIPVRETRRWLRDEADDPELTDAPGRTGDESPRRIARSLRLVARWVEGAAEMIPPEAIRPGDTVVVPASVGGIGLANWDPAALTPVRDRSAEESERVRGTVAVHLTPERCAEAGAAWPDPEDLQPLRTSERHQLLQDLVDSHPELLAGSTAGLSQWRAIPVANRLDEDDRVVRSYVLVARRSTQATPNGPGPHVADDLAVDVSDDSLSLIGRAVKLDGHLRGVGHHAAAFAGALGWPTALVDVIRLAGELHDVGKVDSRFQAILRGGRPRGPVPLAKSAEAAGDLAGRRAARRAAGYPRGTRHELLSLAMLDETFADGPLDHELLAHLVASHHGWGRYRFQPAIDPRPETVGYRATTTLLGDLDLAAYTDHGLEGLNRGHSERYWRLTRRYGWWTLAQLECILRLGDHWRSHLEQAGAIGRSEFANEEEEAP